MTTGTQTLAPADTWEDEGAWSSEWDDDEVLWHDEWLRMEEDFIMER